MVYRSLVPQKVLYPAHSGRLTAREPRNPFLGKSDFPFNYGNVGGVPYEHLAEGVNHSDRTQTMDIVRWNSQKDTFSSNMCYSTDFLNLRTCKGNQVQLQVGVFQIHGNDHVLLCDMISERAD